MSGEYVTVSEAIRRGVPERSLRRHLNSGIPHARKDLDGHWQIPVDYLTQQWDHLASNQPADPAGTGIDLTTDGKTIEPSDLVDLLFDLTTQANNAAVATAIADNNNLHLTRRFDELAHRHDALQAEHHRLAHDLDEAMQQLATQKALLEATTETNASLRARAGRLETLRQDLSASAMRIAHTEAALAAVIAITPKRRYRRIAAYLPTQLLPADAQPPTG